MKNLSFVLSIGTSEDGELANIKLDTTWGSNIDNELKENHNIHIKDIISETLSNEIKKAITPELIKELLNDCEVFNE